MALAATGLFVSEMKQHKPVKPAEVKPKQAVMPLPAVIPVPKPAAASREIAKKAVAVAGEYWKITKMEFRDFTVGGSTLKSAKQEFAKGNYSETLQLAKLSITQLKSAKKYGVKYGVKRGDCLWSIAKMKKHYGSCTMWYSILRANKNIIKNYRLIFVKQKLYIPWVRKND